MKITRKQAVRQDWDQTISWNYKLSTNTPYNSVVYVEITNDHGEVKTNEVERVYFIIDGEGEFEYSNKVINVAKGDLITVPANTTYNYHSRPGSTLKVVLFMELWDN